MRIHQLLPSLLLTVLLGACGTDRAKSTDTKPLTPAQKQAKIERIKLHFNAPVFIDSSVYVMYPLLLNSTEEEDTDSSIGSKSYSRSNTYWNIAFYNPETGESHLLSTTKKMVIYAYSEENAGSETATVSMPDFTKYAKSGPGKLGKQLYYSVRIIDFNHDGVIDLQDPNYLFTSDKAGNNFRQLSPDNYHVESWQMVKGANRILLQGTPDTDSNKVFDERDITTPMICGILPAGPAKAVFSGPFSSSVKQLLHHQWAEKP